MAGATLDALSGGRFIFGFGPTGPQVSEGWYGVPYVKPWGRVREYVGIVREILRREGPLEHSGPHYTAAACSGPGTTDQGKPLKLNFHPVRNEIPVYLGAIGRKSVELCAELADGWIPAYLDPDELGADVGRAPRGRASRRAAARAADLTVSPTVQVAIDGDLETARTGARMRMTLYLGGMGSKQFNFYGELARRMGYGSVADEVQELFLAGEKEQRLQRRPRRDARPRLPARRARPTVGEGLTAASPTPASTG